MLFIDTFKKINTSFTVNILKIWFLTQVIIETALVNRILGV